MASPVILAGSKKVPSSRLPSTQKNREAMKHIIDPFIKWYDELFNLQDDLTTKDEDGNSSEKLMENDNGFEVNEETLFNILSADMRAASRVQPFHTFQILPTIPSSIAERTNLQQKTYSYQLNKCCTERYGKRGTVTRIKYANRVEDVDINAYLTSKLFIDTRNLCEGLQDLTIMKNFLNNLDEFTNYDADCKHSESSSSSSPNI